MCVDATGIGTGDGDGDGDADSDLLAYWSFDEDTGTVAIDETGGGNDGVVDGPTWTEGRLGSALQFDGIDDIVQIGDKLNTLSLPVTYTAWVLLDPVQTGSWIVLETDNAAGGYEGFWMQITPSGFLSASYGDGRAQGGCCRRSKETGDSVPIGQWTHLAAVVEGPTQMTLYVDGVDAGGNYSGSGGAVVQSSALFEIGQPPFIGKIDEVRLYGRALSAAEVMTLAQ